jgi:hypothetical protein
MISLHKTKKHLGRLPVPLLFHSTRKTRDVGHAYRCNARETISTRNVFYMKIKELIEKLVLVITTISCARLRVRAVLSYWIGG